MLKPPPSLRHIGVGRRSVPSKFKPVAADATSRIEWPVKRARPRAKSKQHLAVEVIDLLAQQRAQVFGREGLFRRHNTERRECIVDRISDGADRAHYAALGHTFAAGRRALIGGMRPAADYILQCDASL